MAKTDKPKVDGVDCRILDEIQTNARLSYSEIGRRVGLTSPAVAERIKRMEEKGIILGYHAHLEPQMLGREVQAIVKLTTETRQYPAIHKMANDSPEILECHHLTGEDSFLMKVSAVSIQSLNELVAQLGRYGETKTSIILDSPLPRKNL